MRHYIIRTYQDQETKTRRVSQQEYDLLEKDKGKPPFLEVIMWYETADDLALESAS